MMMYLRLILTGGLIGLLTACAAESLHSGRADEPAVAEDSMTSAAGLDEETTSLNAFQLDVYPPDVPVVINGREEELNPQTFGPFLGPGLYNLEMSVPVTLDGYVSAYEITPVALAQLPSQYAPKTGVTVSVFKDGTIQSYTSVIDPDDGYYQVAVPSDIEYRLAFVPDAPNIPPLIEQRDFLEDGTYDAILEGGRAIFGTVTDVSGAPLREAGVRAIDKHGVSTAWSRTDTNGFYTLRVPEGEWVVICDGRIAGRDPVLYSHDPEPDVHANTSFGYEVATQDIEHNFQYSDLNLKLFSGVVLDANGDGVPNVDISFTSLNLTNYNAPAEMVVNISTNANGNWDTQLIEGLYIAEYAPPIDIDLSPDGPTEVHVEHDHAGQRVLLDFKMLDGQVFDESGFAIAEAQVTCEEMGFQHRAYTTFTDESGAFVLAVPNADLECLLIAPDEELAWTRVQVPMSGPDPEFRIQAGEVVHGSVSVDSTPLEFAFLRLIDVDGRQWASGLSEADGSYRLRVSVTEIGDLSATR